MPRKPKIEEQPLPTRPRSLTRKDIRATEVPGVFVNAMGLKVDERGVALNLKQLLVKDREYSTELNGAPATTPVEHMVAWMRDPQLPTTFRADMAKAAAPYINRKTPSAVDGGVDPTTGAVIPLFGPEYFKDLSEDRLEALVTRLLKEQA